MEVLDETIYLKRGKFALPSGGFINLVTSGGFISLLNSAEGVWVAQSGGFSVYAPWECCMKQFTSREVSLR